MTVNELVILHILPDGDGDGKVPSEELLTSLNRAHQVLESSGGYSFSFFKQLEDPVVVYIVGAWSTTAAHEAFLPSSQNLALLDLFKGKIDIENILMYHLELDPAVTALPLAAAAISRDAFEKHFEEVKPLLQNYTKPWPVAGGWRIEKEAEDKEEGVLFSGFENVESQVGFAKTDEFQNYRSIVEHVDGFEVKHMTRLEVI